MIVGGNRKCSKFARWNVSKLKKKISWQWRASQLCIILCQKGFLPILWKIIFSFSGWQEVYQACRSVSSCRTITQKNCYQTILGIFCHVTTFWQFCETFVCLFRFLDCSRSPNYFSTYVIIYLLFIFRLARSSSSLSEWSGSSPRTIALLWGRAECSKCKW